MGDDVSLVYRNYLALEVLMLEHTDNHSNILSLLTKLLFSQGIKCFRKKYCPFVFPVSVTLNMVPPPSYVKFLLPTVDVSACGPLKDIIKV